MASTSFAVPNRFTGRAFLAAPPPRSRRVSAGFATAERASVAGKSTASFYEVLGIHAGATCQEIKSAYRRLARVLHPDVASAGGGADEFMRVHAAYATLSDPEKRAVYDRSIFRRARAAEGVSSGGGYPEVSRRRRTWETDQCW